MRFTILCLAPLFLCGAERLDLAPFARPCCVQDTYGLQTTFDYSHPAGIGRASDGHWIYGLQWAEERDIAEVRIQFRAPYDGKLAEFQYWFRNWPYDPPAMPTIEDPVDDPWQGSWIAARTQVACEAGACRYTFPPLREEENRRARNLPNLVYRRTIKFRMVFPAGARPEIESVQVFSDSTIRPIQLRVRVSGKPAFAAYNGRIREAASGKDGFLLRVDAAEPKPSGSSDVTIVQVSKGKYSFSFIPSDAEQGPMYIPDFRAEVALASDPAPSSNVRQGARIRERLAAEPEQTYERASREIPPLDPVERQGGQLYLPLAADSSWQKFALEWGGNAAISKRGTKAYGRELKRLTWPGDRISWRIGTGATPSFRARAADSTLSVLEDSLPVAKAGWTSGGIEYEEEAFATLLDGPLSPDARSEQTPAVLMVQVRARNRAGSPAAAHLWIGMSPAEPLAFDGTLLTAGTAVRAAVHLASTDLARVDLCNDGAAEMPALHIESRLEAGGQAVTHLALPFIPDLSAEERARLAALAHETERARVIEYWRGAAARGLPFQVPEERFNSFARGLLAHIRISATKDPKSGIYMAPAASYNYKVYANEAVFQAQLLDVLGYHDLARKYFQAQVDLQGSKPFDGTYTGGQRAVYHGARVDVDYDYTASQYNLDHGTVLWSLAEHYFQTRDREWFRQVAPSMKRAADWIVEQRKLTQAEVDGAPCPEYGLLPAGHLEDNHDWGHWFSVNAYASAGMTSLAKVLAEIGDPQAEKYRREAAAYLADLRSAILRAAGAAPVIRLRDNTWVPYVPTRVHQRIRLFGPLRVDYYRRYPQKVLPTYRLSATREVLYGPMILLETGIFGVDEPLARWVLDDWEDNATTSEPLGLHVHGWVDEDYWFSRGGMVFQANLQNPVRTYLRRGEARAAIRNLYNDFVACYYPAVNVFTEEYRQWRGPSGPFYKIPDEAKFVHRLRDVLVTEYDDDLLLAAGTPGRWLKPGEQIAVRGAPTHYGPVSYTLKASEEAVEGAIDLPKRNRYRNAYIHVRLPEGTAMGAVTIDGKPWTGVDRTTGRIRLPQSRQPLKLAVRTAKVWGTL